MIEVQGTVVTADGGGRVWIEADHPLPGCGQCAGHCTVAIVSRAWGLSRQFQAESGLPLRAGDAVMLGIAERALLRGSIQIYLWPLLLFFLGALAGQTVAGELIAVAMGLAGLGLGLLRARRVAWRLGDALQPVVRRRVAGEAAADCRSDGRSTGF
jgi:sigma-E factor negative regulatory protein RseC